MGQPGLFLLDETASARFVAGVASDYFQFRRDSSGQSRLQLGHPSAVRLPLVDWVGFGGLARCAFPAVPR